MVARFGARGRGATGMLIKERYKDVGDRIFCTVTGMAADTGTYASDNTEEDKIHRDKDRSNWGNLHKIGESSVSISCCLHCAVVLKDVTNGRN